MQVWSGADVLWRVGTERHRAHTARREGTHVIRGNPDRIAMNEGLGTHIGIATLNIRHLLDSKLHYYLRGGCPCRRSSLPL